MPYMNDYLTELELGSDKEVENYFNLALKQVFSKSYLSKIEKTINNKVKFKEKVNKNPDVVAWAQGTTIYVNRPEFEKRDAKSKIKYLLHEFLHILNNSRSFIIVKQFKEINELSKKLWSITKKHAKDPGLFLAGRSIKGSFLNNQEALSYLMNDKINWKAISPEGAKLFKQALKDSGVFNIEHEFWKKRLQ